MTEPATRASADPAKATGICAPSFVGRVQQRTALEAALSGPPGLVLVAGEAGIGKSRLLREVFAAEAPRRDQRVLVGSCPPFREPYTLGPIVDAVREVAVGVRGLTLSPLAGALRPLFPEWVADLPDAPEPAADATAARHRLFRALMELLDCLRVDVLVVEDVHWADEATLEFLLFLVTRRPQQRSLVLSYRPDDVPGESLLFRLSSRVAPGTTVLRLVLEPLDVDETEALVTSMLPGAHVSSEFAAFVHGRTEGLPLAIEESLRLMHDQADLTLRDGGWVRRHLDDIAVPPTVRDAVLERAGRLGVHARAVVQAAAVLGEPAEEPMLLAVAGLPAARGRSGLAEALRCGLLHEDARGRFAFRHALASKAVYEAITAPLRRELHLRAGGALREVSPPPLMPLTRHHRSGGDVANWSRYAEQAAESAIAAGDDVTAATLLHELITTADLPAGSLVRLVRILPMTSLPRHERMSSLDRALRASLATKGLEPAVEAELRFQLAQAAMVRGDYEAAQPELMRAVRQLPRGSAERARAMIFLGLPHRAAQAASVHREWLRQAEEAVAAVSPGPRLRLHIDRTTALLMLGEPSGWQGADRIPDDTDVARERGELIRGHGNVGELAMWWGRYDEARRRLSHAIALAEQYEALYLRDSKLAALARLDWLTGRWAGLAERMAPLVDDEQLWPALRAEATLVLGLLGTALGDRAEAEGRLLARHTEGHESGAIDRFAEPAAALARLWLADGRVQDGLRITAEPVEIAVQKGIWVCGVDVVPARVDLLVAADRADEARELVATYAQLVDGKDAPTAQAALASCEAMLATEADRAAELFGAAARAWLALPRPYDAALVRERQAAWLVIAGDVKAGTAVLRDVLAEYSRLGAGADADRVAHTLRGHGVAVPRAWRGGRRGYRDQLSPRELEVVRLVTTGRTNREIAKALSRSAATVASQLNSAMQKVGVTSRTALTARVIEDGLLEQG